VAVGRYPEDVYYSGNPWYLNTLAASEILYDALYVWRKQKFITVTAVSQPFFHDHLPSLKIGTYDAESPTYITILASISAYADGFMEIVARYAARNGSLSEQFDKQDGTPLSAHDLTWSYAAFLTAAARRQSVVPRSWGALYVRPATPKCSPAYVVGTYSSVTDVSFPPSQTPTIPTTTTTTTTSNEPPQPTASQPACNKPVDVVVVFEETVSTIWGETIKVVGSVNVLGDWDVGRAVPLDARDYSPERPVWRVSITLGSDQVIEYKYIKVQKDGSIEWEGDPNHTIILPPACTATAIARRDMWQDR
jgi:glucoamylase